MTARKRLVFQLGSEGRSAPGEVPATLALENRQQALHRAFNDLPTAVAVSTTATGAEAAGGDGTALGEEVFARLARAELDAGMPVSLAIAHDTNQAPLLMRNAIARRMEEGGERPPLLCFVTGPIERGPADALFDHRRYAGDRDGLRIDVCAAGSQADVEALVEAFPHFPRERVLLVPGEYDERVYREIRRPRHVHADRVAVLAELATVASPDGARAPRPVRVADGFNKVVIFSGDLSDASKADAVLHAAAAYERSGRGVVTLVAGAARDEDRARAEQLAYEELGLRDVFFLGARRAEGLAVLYNSADLAIFPSAEAASVRVLSEAMACATPVVAADAEATREVVGSSVGELVKELDDRRALGRALAATIERALDEDWKSTKGPAAARRAALRYSVRSQCSALLDGTDAILAA